MPPRQQAGSVSFNSSHTRGYYLNKLETFDKRPTTMEQEYMYQVSLLAIQITFVIIFMAPITRGFCSSAYIMYEYIYIILHTCIYTTYILHRLALPFSDMFVRDECAVLLYAYCMV